MKEQTERWVFLPSPSVVLRVPALILALRALLMTRLKPVRTLLPPLPCSYYANLCARFDNVVLEINWDSDVCFPR